MCVCVCLRKKDGLLGTGRVCVGGSCVERTPSNRVRLGEDRHISPSLALDASPLSAPVPNETSYSLTLGL